MDLLFHVQICQSSWVAAHVPDRAVCSSRCWSPEVFELWNDVLGSGCRQCFQLDGPPCLLGCFQRGCWVRWWFVRTAPDLGPRGLSEPLDGRLHHAGALAFRVESWAAPGHSGTLLGRKDWFLAPFLPWLLCPAWRPLNAVL